ncbi:hypothetical protein P8A22_00350 [Streptomyces laculatispora]|uniref:Uncharacterized protein n=1 Tax=Streptomyces laculatispora TaxID=887464 RepID=A0ABY9HXF4_9ACTN|nr:hypothetical protein [Streptomyces laculatispora]WLQ38638.1 hypothetical protein P8A22_00350 [Streptomyces laculatispora]
MNPGTRRLGAGLTGALICSVTLALGDCGVLSTKEERRFAETLTDEHYPGMLEVIDRGCGGWTRERSAGSPGTCSTASGRTARSGAWGGRAVVVTTDVRGEPVGEVRPAGTVREGRGPLRLPPL